MAFLPDPVEPTVAGMRSQLPGDRVVWLLRWEGEPPVERKPGAPELDATRDLSLYMIVHPNCGVFARGEKSVVAVTAQSSRESGPPMGAQAEGERFLKLSDLVAMAKSS